jgi:hypothetical protein
VDLAREVLEFLEVILEHIRIHLLGEECLSALIHPLSSRQSIPSHLKTKIAVVENECMIISLYLLGYYHDEKNGKILNY